jgi:hypothetical protein
LSRCLWASTRPARPVRARHKERTCRIFSLKSLQSDVIAGPTWAAVRRARADPGSVAGQMDGFRIERRRHR